MFYLQILCSEDGFIGVQSSTNFIPTYFFLPNASLKMLSQIAYKQIRDNLWLGQYGDFKVVMMKDCGFINATKLCKDGGKQLKNWLANETSKCLIRALEDQLGHQASAFTPLEQQSQPRSPCFYTAAHMSAAVCKYVQILI